MGFATMGPPPSPEERAELRATLERRRADAEQLIPEGDTGEYIISANIAAELASVPNAWDSLRHLYYEEAKARNLHVRMLVHAETRDVYVFWRPAKTGERFLE